MVAVNRSFLTFRMRSARATRQETGRSVAGRCAASLAVNSSLTRNLGTAKRHRVSDPRSLKV